MSNSKRYSLLNFGNLAEEKMGRLSALQKFGFLVDFVVERLLHNTKMMEYFQFDLYERNAYGKAKYATYNRMKHFTAVVNDKQKSDIFRDKAKFSEVFRDYMHRESMDLRSATLAEFEAFTQRHPSFFVKPVDGSWGRGTRIETRGEDSGVAAHFERLRKEGCAVEEVLTQYSELAAFNSTSVNSIRIVTFVQTNGKSCLMPGAVIRIGRKGKVADNFHHNGIGALIDIESGCVCTRAIDKTGARYVYHPDSNKMVIGFKVPFWKEICQTVLEAALVVPEVRYVGWDVTVNADGEVVLIEGNDRADPDLGQMSERIGKWPAYTAYMKEVLSMKK